MRSGWKICLFAFAVLAAGATAAAAQSAESRWTIGATAGLGGTWDDEGSIGRGALAGGYTQWRWLEHTAIEGSAEILTHDRSGGAFEAHGHTTLLGTSVFQQFGGGRRRGYVMGGVLLGLHSGSAGFPALDELRHSSSSRHGYSFGGGLNFRSGRIEMGPIARIVFMSTAHDSDPWSLAMAGFRIGFHQ